MQDPNLKEGLSWDTSAQAYDAPLWALTDG